MSVWRRYKRQRQAVHPEKLGTCEHFYISPTGASGKIKSQSLQYTFMMLKHGEELELSMMENKPYSMAPFPLSSQPAPEGIEDAFSRYPSPSFSSPSLA